MTRRSPLVPAVLACIAWSLPLAAQQAADPDPARFNAEVEAFAEWDQKNSTPPDAVLFAGSSSIRFWPTAERFPQLPVINRGFGGSHISDVNHFIDQTVLKYQPATIVFYAGDNDIAGGKTADRVLADYRIFVERVMASRPDTDILFVAIKPSLARWNRWPAMKDANEKIRAYSASRPHLHFADIAPPMLGADGKPKPALFRDDGLHLTPAGYDIWTDVVSQALAAVRKPDTK